MIGEKDGRVVQHGLLDVRATCGAKQNSLFDWNVWGQILPGSLLMDDSDGLLQIFLVAGVMHWG